MKFDELDARMRVFETAHDLCALPGLWLVARLDGRGFTRLTKETLELEAPFDERFRDAMLNTTEHLMNAGLCTIYGYTQSDEISLLLARDEASFGRKLRKLDSVLAGEASGRLSLDLGVALAFDCRISQLPTERDVIDYFRWRSEDAHRNALNAHCYWRLRAEGATARQATRQLEGMSVADKNELLFARGINFNDLPAWQRRGSGLYWEEYVKEGVDPRTGATAPASRRRIRRDLELPMRDAYSNFVAGLIETGGAETGTAGSREGSSQ